jgi:membrane protein required for beta-lactamase induction
MTFLSILIALLIERIAPQLVEFRRFQWLRDYGQWLVEVLHIEKLGSWMTFAILLAPLLIVMWVLNGMFEHALFGLFELAFNVIVVFLCIGPRDLDKQIDHYLDAIDIGDEQQRFASASRLTTDTPATELSAQAVQVCKSLFIEANIRVYAVLFWFVVLGPVAAVMYRLLDQWYRKAYLPESLSGIHSEIGMLAGWLDWIPTRLTMFAYMISGSFDAGLQAYRSMQHTAINAYHQNCEFLQSVGFHSLSVDDAGSKALAMDMVRKSRGLILRSLVVWLVLILFVSFLH